MSNEMDLMRADFEAWAYSVEHKPYGWLGRNYFTRAGDSYEDDYAHGLWAGWQAARQQAVPVVLARFRDIADFTLREAGRHNKWQEREALAKEFLDFIDAPLSFRIVRADASGITETGLSFASPERAAQHADDMNATKNNSLVIFKVLAGALHKPAERVAYAAPQAEQQKPEFGAPYQGAREEMAIWKRRALEAEQRIREQDQIIDRLGDALNADNGPVRFGEPVFPQAEQAAEPVIYWVLFDDTGGPKFIKKSLDDGSLAVFDNEPDAKAAKRRHKGTDYKRVEYFTAPQPAAPTPDACALVEALEQIQRADYQAGHDASDYDILQNLCVAWNQVNGVAYAALAAHQNREG